MQKLITLATLTLLLAGNAQANAYLSVQSGSDGISFSDSGALTPIGTATTSSSSFTPNSAMAWSGTVGSLWTLTITASLNYSGTPGMLLNATATTTGAGTLNIRWAGDSFIGSMTPFAAMNGFTPGSVSYQWTITSGTFPNLSTSSGTLGPLSGSFSDSATGSSATPSAYSLDEYLTITSSGGTATSPSRTILTASISPASVPDGGSTVALLGFALAGIAGLRRQLIK